MSTRAVRTSSKPREVRLTADERKAYGSRFPDGYHKIKLLGKGGLAVVWLADNSDGTQYAVKAILLANGKNTAEVEIEVQ